MFCYVLLVLRCVATIAVQCDMAVVYYSINSYVYLFVIMFNTMNSISICILKNKQEIKPEKVYGQFFY